MLDALNRVGSLIFFEFTSPILSVRAGHNNTENRKAGVKVKPYFTLSSEIEKAVSINKWIF